MLTTPHPLSPCYKYKPLSKAKPAQSFFHRLGGVGDTDIGRVSTDRFLFVRDEVIVRGCFSECGCAGAKGVRRGGAKGLRRGGGREGEGAVSVWVYGWIDGGMTMERWMTAERVLVRLGRASRYVGRMDWVVGWLVIE